MKTVIILVVFLSPIYIFGQSSNSDETFSLNFQVGYLFPQNTGGGGGYSTLVPGLEYRPSIHYKLSNKVKFVLEFSYCNLNYKSKERENMSVTFETINAGLKIYPKSDDKSVYLKPAITFSLNDEWNIKSITNINMEFGMDFKISNEVSAFGEAGIFLRNSQYTFSFSVSAGLSYKFL